MIEIYAILSTCSCVCIVCHETRLFDKMQQRLLIEVRQG